MTKKITWEQHITDIKHLEPYIDLLEGRDEFESAAESLFNLEDVSYRSEEFQQSYYKEIRALLKWFKENTKIKEQKVKTKTFEQPAYKYLHYKDQDY